HNSAHLLRRMRPDVNRGRVVPNEKWLATLAGLIHPAERDISHSRSMVSMRLRVSGPVSSIFWRPTLPHLGSTVASSVSVDQVCSTPRGPNFFRYSGFLCAG